MKWSCQVHVVWYPKGCSSDDSQDDKVYHEKKPVSVTTLKPFSSQGSVLQSIRVCPSEAFDLNF